jgi:hypothetical protein
MIEGLKIDDLVFDFLIQQSQITNRQSIFNLQFPISNSLSYPGFTEN